MLRSDPDFVAALPTFLRNVEARLRREIIHTSMEQTTEITVTDRFYALAADILEVRSLSMQGTTRRLQLVTPEVIREGPLWDSSGTPQLFSIEGRNLVFAPTPSSSILMDMVSYRALTPLTGDASTNTLLTNYYDLYLNLMLFEAHKFIHHDERAGLFFAAYVDVRDALMTQDNDYVSRGSARRSTGSRFKV